MTFEEIDGAHLREWGGVDTYPPDNRMTGFAARSPNGDLVALAIAYLTDDGAWRVAFARRQGCTAGVHQEVRRALAQVFEAGVPEILADADPRVRRSADYLSWLGFVPRNDDSGDWVMRPSDLRG